jgi:hypothetical protein
MLGLDAFTVSLKGIEVFGSGELTLEHVQTVDVSFRLTLQPLGNGCELLCWSPLLKKTEWRDHHFSFVGRTINDFSVEAEGGNARVAPHGDDTIAKSRMNPTRASLAVKMHCDEETELNTTWVAPLVGMDFWGDTQQIARIEAVSEGGEVAEDCGWRTDAHSTRFAWGERSVLLRRPVRNTVPKVDGVPLCGTITVSSPTSIAIDDAFEYFAVLNDLLAPHGTVLWHPNIVFAGFTRRMEWRHSAISPSMTGAIYHRPTHEMDSIKSYAEAVMSFYESLDTERKRAALRGLARHLAAPDVPVTTAILSTCAGYEIIRDHFWTGVTEYGFPPAAMRAFKEATKQLGESLVGSQHDEYEEIRAGACNQFFRRPLKSVVVDILTGYLTRYFGAAVFGDEVVTTVERRNKIVHTGLLKEGDDENQALRDALKAKRALWTSFKAMIGMGRGETIIPENPIF